jgi:histone H1/5
MSDAVATPAPAKAQKAKMPRKPTKRANHPKYIVMIIVAIAALKERGGSSRKAILKYIMANYKVGNEVTRINARLKTALKAGVKARTLKQAIKPKAAKPKKVAKPKTAKPKKAKPLKKASARRKLLFVSEEGLKAAKP